MKFRYSAIALAALAAAACSDISKPPTGIAAVGATDGKLWLGDARAPEVTYALTGTQAPSGWFWTDVGITWSISDPDHTLLTTEGCEPASLTTDAAIHTFSCHITSLLGPTTYAVGVMRDATPPVMTVSGNLGTYTVDQIVSITCTASDAMSGPPSADCGSQSGEALAFGIGEHVSIAIAIDNAGNYAPVDHIRFNVVLTPGGVCGLAKRWASNGGVSNSMCKALNDGDYVAFRKKVETQSGKAFSPANAATLITLSNSL